MIRLIIKTLNVLMKRKSYIIIGMIMPVFIVIFFSFEFTDEYKFKVGVIDKDNSYVSKEIIKTINDLEGIQAIEIKEDDYETLLITHQIQMYVTIYDDFQKKLLNLDNNEIKIEATNESDVKEVVQTAINLKCEDLSLIANMSNKNINKFKEINQAYNDEITQLSLNDVDKETPKIESSLGLIIFLILIAGGNIVNFLIENEEINTKKTILNSSINKWKYYVSLIIVFYIMLSMIILIYYVLARIFNINFGMVNTIKFLIVMLFLNLFVISFNLCLVTLTKSRYTFGIVNIFIMVPCCMLSGVFWDFYIMPENFQVIGEFMPIRWIYVCIENLQKTNNLSVVNAYLSAMFFLSTIFFAISFIKLKIARKF